MKEVTSAEFRRSYAGLTEQVRVMAGKRILGTWIPVSVMKPYELDPSIEAKEGPRVKLMEVSLVEDTPGNRAAGAGYIIDDHFGGSRPAPKPGTKK